MPCSGARAPRSLGTHPPKKVPTFADYLVFGGAAVDGAPGTFSQVILTRHADLPRSREQCLGTLQYMSPEQLHGQDADPRSDLFSFGCMLYEMLTGKRAFEGQSAASVIAAILERE